METTENNLTVNDHDPEGPRDTDERDSFIPRAYDKYWETLGTSRDRGNKKHKRKVVSCIPAVSTHGETEWLSPLIDWEKEFYKYK